MWNGVKAKVVRVCCDIAKAISQSVCQEPPTSPMIEFRGRRLDVGTCRLVMKALLDFRASFPRV